MRTQTKAKEIATRYDVRCAAVASQHPHPPTSGVANTCHAAAAVSQYITDPDARTVLSRIITDWWFRCASEQFAIANTKSGTKAFVCVAHSTLLRCHCCRVTIVRCHCALCPACVHSYVYNHLLSDPELFPESVQSALVVRGRQMRFGSSPSRAVCGVCGVQVRPSSCV